MSNGTFLHDHKEFPSLLEILAKDLSILPVLIEKDYWIMHCLFGLLDLKFNIELKGGTSLSKGYKVIDRFSEDIDIKIDPPKDMDVKTGPNHDKPNQIQTRIDFFNWLTDKIKIPGIVSVERDTTFDSDKARGIGIRLKYKSHYNPLPKLKEGVLLEVGFDSTTPNQKITISSWAYDKAASIRVPVLDNRAIDVPCYLPQYTFVEKLQAISTKYRQQQGNGEKFPINFLRHYYDIYRLLELEAVQSFLGTEEYKKHKNDRFREADNKNIATNEAFLLSDEKIRKEYETEYKKSASLYYKGQVPFGEILERIKLNVNKL